MSLLPRYVRDVFSRLEITALPELCTYLVFMTEDIRTVIDANCSDVLIYWKPVSGAERYRLQFHEKDDIFLNKTANENSFKISLSNSPFKDKEMFSVEVCICTCDIVEFLVCI